MYAQPGKKLLFMGGEFGQWREWVHDDSLEWDLLDYEPHKAVQRWVKDLNHLYRNEPTLHEWDCESRGFEWIDCSDTPASVLCWLRKGKSPGAAILVVCNFTPVPRCNYRVGAPRPGFWKELLNSDAAAYGGSNQGNFGGVESSAVPLHGRPHSLTLTLPPLAVIFLKSEEG